jgi:hypothetical protein
LALEDETAAGAFIHTDLREGGASCGSKRPVTANALSGQAATNKQSQDFWHPDWKSRELTPPDGGNIPAPQDAGDHFVFKEHGYYKDDES